jgi:hypothetical protein
VRAELPAERFSALYGRFPGAGVAGNSATLDVELDLNPASVLEGKCRSNLFPFYERLRQMGEHYVIAPRREPNGSVCGNVEAVLQLGHCHHAVFRLHFMNLDSGEVRRTAGQLVGSDTVIVDDEIARADLGPFGRRARPRLVNSDVPAPEFLSKRWLRDRTERQCQCDKKERPHNPFPSLSSWSIASTRTIIPIRSRRPAPYIIPPPFIILSSRHSAASRKVNGSISSKAATDFAGSRHPLISP